MIIHLFRNFISNGVKLQLTLVKVDADIADIKSNVSNGIGLEPAVENLIFVVIITLNGE